MATDSTKLVFLGASTAFQEIGEIIRCINRESRKYEISAILDDNEQLHGKVIDGVKVVGSLDRAKEYKTEKFVFGIGSMKTRLMRHKIFEKLQLDDDRFESIVHPSAHIDHSAKIGPGCIIHAGACIGNDAILEPFSIVAVNSAIGPFVRLGRYSMVTTLAVVLTGATVGNSAFVGAGSCVAERVELGAGSMLGIGTVISSDLKPGYFALGNPARVIGKEDVPPELL